MTWGECVRSPIRACGCWQCGLPGWVQWVVAGVALAALIAAGYWIGGL